MELSAKGSEPIKMTSGLVLLADLVRIQPSFSSSPNSLALIRRRSRIESEAEEAQAAGGQEMGAAAGVAVAEISAEAAVADFQVAVEDAAAVEGFRAAADAAGEVRLAEEVRAAAVVVVRTGLSLGIGSGVRSVRFAPSYLSPRQIQRSMLAIFL